MFGDRCCRCREKQSKALTTKHMTMYMKETADSQCYCLLSIVKTLWKSYKGDVWFDLLPGSGGGTRIYAECKNWLLGGHYLWCNYLTEP